MINKLAVIGVGLIGGSLIHSLKNLDAVKEVIGFDQDQENLNKALKLKIIDKKANSVEKLIKDADVVVIATPVGSIGEIFQEVAKYKSPETIVTDVGSTKFSVLNDIKKRFGEIPEYFVGSHPIAGTENSGVEFSFASLFNDKQVILTPTKNTNSKTLNLITKMWQKTGAKVSHMDAKKHDKIFAATSHFPHLIAYSLLNLLGETPEFLEFSGAGFKDFTRISASDPKMWSDICLANKNEINTLINKYKKLLSNIEKIIKNDDYENLLKNFTKAQQIRIKNIK